MLFDTIKKQARDCFIREVDSELCLDARKWARGMSFEVVAKIGPFTEGERRAALQQAKEAGLRLIDTWDVRCVGALLARFPEAAPASWRGRKLVCFLDDAGDWRVDTKPTQQERQGYNDWRNP